MSLYGALFGAVSGLNAQSSKISAISDNIANSNTIGYKEAQTTFETLVINSSNNASQYQPGGVRTGTQIQVDQQGLLQSTNSPTDLAISGGGFFVVRSTADSTATPLYTRAGSFTQDSLGNFINTEGFYLQGWPLDRNGLLPGEPGNLDTTSSTNLNSLETVNVESASGTAQATTTVALGANLNAGQTILAGESMTLSPDATDSTNANLAADSILVGSEYGMATTNGITRGDEFSLTASGPNNNVKYTYQYGGFAVGRNITTSVASGNNGDGNIDNTALVDISTNGLEEGPVVNTLQLTGLTGSGLITGDQVTLSGFVGTVGTTTPISASEVNGTHTVTVDSITGAVTFTTADDTGDAAATDESQASTTADVRQFTGNVLDASTVTDSFISTSTGTSGFTTAALTFSVTTVGGSNGGVTSTFTYTPGSPNTLSGQFSNLTNLAEAIDSTTGLTARVVNGRLVVGAADASEGLTFTNGDATGSATAHGIDWTSELDLQNVAEDSAGTRFSNLQGLANIVNSQTGVQATISNPLTDATLSIGTDDPQGTIQFADLPPAEDISGVGVVDVSSTSTPGTAGAVAAGDPIYVTITATPPTGLAIGDSIYLSGLDPADFAGSGLAGNLPNGGPYTVTHVDTIGGTYQVSIPAPQDETIVVGPYDAATGSTAADIGATNTGSVLSAFGLTDSLAGTAYNNPAAPGGPFTASTPQQTAVLGPEYTADPTGGIGANMASGDITPQFSRNVELFDALGGGHNITFGFVKIASNTWAVEAYAVPASDVTVGPGLTDGQIAAGTIKFNGDGTLLSVSSGLVGSIPITWTNGAVGSTVSLNLGTAGQPFGTLNAVTIGKSDGLSQFDSAYNVNFANQNGAAVGQLVSVAVDSSGKVIASYSNGETQALFQLPLAEFAEPDGLQAITGNVFAQTKDSGEVNLREAGTNGTGSIASSQLEQSNVDLATELTDMIVAQRAYQANTQVIKAADQLLDSLSQI